MKFQPIAAGLAGGLVLGIFTLGFTWLSILTGGYGEQYLSIWIDLHPGYAITWTGGVVGFVYTFIEGFVWLYVGANIYNFFAKE